MRSLTGPRGDSRHRLVASALALALVLGAASCSSDDADGRGPVAMAPAATSASSTTGPLPTGTGRDDFVRGVQAGIGPTLTRGGATDDQVACIAQLWVQGIGVDAFTSRGLTADKVADPSFSYGTLGIDDQTADELLNAFGTCGVDLVGFALNALAPLVEKEQFDCIISKVTPEQGRAIGRELLVGGQGAETATASIGAIAERCGIDLG